MLAVGARRRRGVVPSSRRKRVRPLSEASLLLHSSFALGADAQEDEVLVVGPRWSGRGGRPRWPAWHRPCPAGGASRRRSSWALHAVGRPVSWLTPSSLGPRHCGQLNFEDSAGAVRRRQLRRGGGAGRERMPGEGRNRFAWCETLAGGRLRKAARGAAAAESSRPRQSRISRGGCVVQGVPVFRPSPLRGCGARGASSP